MIYSEVSKCPSSELTYSYWLGSFTKVGKVWAPPTCTMGCRYSPQSSQSNRKSNFQNELTNKKFDSNSKLNLAYRQHHNVKPNTLFHFRWVLQSAKQFWSLKWSHHYGNFMGCHHGTGLAQHWHLAVTSNVTLAFIKIIVTVVFCHIRAHSILRAL